MIVRVYPRLDGDGDLHRISDVSIDGEPAGEVHRWGAGDWEAFSADGAFLECHETRRDAVRAVIENAGGRC